MPIEGQSSALEIISILPQRRHPRSSVRRMVQGQQWGLQGKCRGLEADTQLASTDPVLCTFAFWPAINISKNRH